MAGEPRAVLPRLRRFRNIHQKQGVWLILGGVLTVAISVATLVLALDEDYHPAIVTGLCAAVLALTLAWWTKRSGPC